MMGINRTELTPAEAYQELVNGKELMPCDPASSNRWVIMYLFDGTFRITDMLTGRLSTASSSDTKLVGWAKFDKAMFSKENPEWVGALLSHLRIKAFEFEDRIKRLERMIHRDVFGTWQFHNAVEKVQADIAEAKEEKEEARKEWRDELMVIVTEICEQKGCKTQKRKADK